MCVATLAIQTAIDIVANRLGKLSGEKIQRIEENARLDDMIEAIAYQDLQARGHAAGKISTESALWMYRLVGGEMPSEKTFNKHSLPERIVAMEILGHLIKG